MKGFTLIELLVVVLVIGILASVALPQYQRAVDKSKYMRLAVLTNAVKKAQETYYMANGAYATKFEELDVSLPSSYKLALENSTAGGQCFSPSGVMGGDQICTGPNGTYAEPFGVSSIQYHCKYAAQKNWNGKCFCTVNPAHAKAAYWSSLCAGMGKESTVLIGGWKSWEL